MKYISPTSSKPCSFPQYLAEIITKRKADKEKIVLQDKWWNHSSWKSLFQRNIMAAHSLIKIFDEQAILKGIKHKDCSWCYTLQHKCFIPIIKEEQQKLEFERKRLEKVTIVPINTETVVETRPSFGKESKRSKLDG